MKIIGLDVGEKRIGVAKVDTNTKIAIPVGFVEADGTEWQKLTSISNLNNTKCFVLGLPRSNEGNETAQSAYVRQFAKTLTEKIPGATIRFEDETLTSVLAEKRLKARKKNYQKGDIDAESATIILQEFVDNYKEKISTLKPEQDPKNDTIIDKSVHKVKKSTKKIMLNSKKAKDKSKKILRAFIIPPIVLVIIAAILACCVLWYRNSITPIDSTCTETTCETVTFEVQDGDTTEIIGQNLEQAGLIRSSFFFKIHIFMNHRDETLKTGIYELNYGLSMAEITDLLIAGSKTSNVFNFTIRPGETLMDVKNNLISVGYSTSEITAAFNQTYDYSMLSGAKDLEGFLYPETYEFYQSETVENIIKKFLDGMESVISENDLTSKYAAQGLSLYEGIILASIVQKEAYSADQPTVAQVFISRLNSGWTLGSDVTATYAADLVDPDRTTYTDNSAVLNIDSCYNTRKYAGIPCGAISNPGINALLAVANPTDTSYLYFLTGDDGKMYYSYTESEHNQNAARYCQKLCNASL